MNRKVRTFIVTGVLLALSLVFSYIEILVPVPFPVPGFRLGLSNIVIVFVLFTFGWQYALVMGLLKSLLMFLLFGNLFGLVLSLSGFAFSFTIMAVLGRMRSFSAGGVSIAGGIFHNLGQLLGVFLLTGRASVFRLMPLLSVLGAVTGLLIGLLTLLLLERFKYHDWIC